MPPSPSVNWMREASPFIRSHRNKVFVIYVGGEVLLDSNGDNLFADLILLIGLGIRLVIVHGARPQINQACREAQLDCEFVTSYRVTDEHTLKIVKQCVALARLEIEAKLSKAALDTSTRTASLTISSGGLTVARPAGVIAGTDLGFTGEIRRIDAARISKSLEGDEIVLLSPLGFSASGEIFNLNALDYASTVATEIQADKFLIMAETSIKRADDTTPLREITLREARNLTLDENSTRDLACALNSVQGGVTRAHIIDRHIDGALLQELFTRDGSGTLISERPFDELRRATIGDLAGIISLIDPLEASGVLVKRSRDQLERDIERFVVLVREGTVVACGVVNLFASEALAEFACIAVHPEYRKVGFGNTLLSELERCAQAEGATRAFVLTTQAPQWFEERGFTRVDLDTLPGQRQALYNYQRNSIVLSKVLLVEA